VADPTAGPTVLIPVYRGRDEVARCVESVLRHAETTRVPFDLLLIDDSSPEPEVTDYVRSLGEQAAPVPVRVLRNEENLGFVATVNRGFTETTGDVVVLNADTVVTEGWLDRLVDAAAEPDVATVTPLTNFGSICTLPATIIAAFDLDGASPQIDECAAYIAEQSLALRPEVITGVGFCMYVTRHAIDEVGLLDVETFGLGYGEEVDFCLRATRIGLRHLVEDATYVYHEGGVSFGEARTEGMARGSSLLHDRYRFFRPANTRERAENPLSVPFAVLELGLAERDESRPHVLQLLHSPPGALGGTEKHLHRLMTALFHEFDFSVLYPVESGFVVRTFWNLGDGAPVEHEFLLPGAARRAHGVHDHAAANALRSAIDLFGFDAVHVQNLIGHSLAPLDVLADFPGPVVYSVRDLYLACPHHWLLYRNQEACGIPDDLDVCARCLPETQQRSVEFLRQFRDTVAARVDTVDHWVFASQSAADYLLRVYDIESERISIIEHGAIIDVNAALREPDPPLFLDEPLRLAFVGLGWAKKGLDVVNRVADELAGSSIEIHHFGELKADASPNLHCHGPYDNELLPYLLDRAGIQIVLLPGPYAETFGHVMTEALIAGRPVIGARYGALGERIRRTGAGWTFEPDDPPALRRLVEHLDECRLEVLRAAEAAASTPIFPVASTAGAYEALYRAEPPAGGTHEPIEEETTP
jgi:GT2 family glycosyltransferase/glycosyltransferase involved in cell wall biosynthesis